MKKTNLECPNARIICRYMENWEDIHCRLKKKMVRYWSRILKSSEYKLNKVMYIILYNPHCKNVNLSLWNIYMLVAFFLNCGCNYAWLTQY